MAPLRVVPNYEEHVCSSALKRTRETTTVIIISGGIGGGWPPGAHQRATESQLRYNLHHGRVVKLAATADSKSAEGNLMSVRLRPRPPSPTLPRSTQRFAMTDPIRLRPILVENGPKFTHFLTQFLG